VRHSSATHRPALLIVNPAASRLADERRRAALIRDVTHAVGDRFGAGPEVVAGSHAEAVAALRDVEDRPLVVVAGGDGSVREAATVLATTEVPLAIVPGGTGNVLAGALGLGARSRALAAIRGGRTRRIDLGRARWGDEATVTDERVFTVACGMGLDARVMAAAEGEWKRHVGFGAYVGATVRELARLEPAHFRIDRDGTHLAITGLVVLVANCGDLVPGRLGARRPIDPTDGRLDLLVVGGRSVLDGLRGAVELLVRRETIDGSVVRGEVSSVRIEADPPQPIQVDGDHFGASWLEATVLPGALTVLGPVTR
jgi:diacylglycerol kinase family enzyme